MTLSNKRTTAPLTAMLAISEADVLARIARDNPWWNADAQLILEAAYPRRVYFEPFRTLALDFGVKRATVLLGPRRVGKTVVLRQVIHEAIASGFNPRAILYASIDAPIYSGIALERFLDLIPERHDKQIVIFDEIQYLKNWEIHLKDLVDNNQNIKFIASGSAAAALRLKSQESGAGRFTDFMLPPLTFYEFLKFIGKDDELIDVEEEGRRKLYHAKDIGLLNEMFVSYLNYGGYPEAVLNDTIRNNPEQFIRSDIIDKVLLKDLPSSTVFSHFWRIIQEMKRV